MMEIVLKLLSGSGYRECISGERWMRWMFGTITEMGILCILKHINIFEFGTILSF